MLSRGAWLGQGAFSKMLPVQVDEILALQPESGNVTRHMWVLSEQRSSKVHSWPDLQSVIAAEHTAKVNCQIMVVFGPVHITNLSYLLIMQAGPGQRRHAGQMTWDANLSASMEVSNLSGLSPCG